MTVDADFELFDLRVEVAAPEGARLWCGSKRGDYFEVRGEMLHFPPGRPFSIYQCGRRPAAAARQAASDRRPRLDDDGLRGGLPGPELSEPLAHHSPRQAAVSVTPTPPPSRCIRLSEDESRTHRNRARLQHLPPTKGGWHLAGGHGRGRRATKPSPTCAHSSKPASPPSTAPTTIPAWNSSSVISAARHPDLQRSCAGSHEIRARSGARSRP